MANLLFVSMKETNTHNNNTLRIFSPLTESEWAQIFSTSTELMLLKEQVLVHSGDTANSAFILISGQLAVYTSSFSRQKRYIKPIATIEPGSIIGEAGFLDGQKRSATLLANEDSVICEISRENFETLRLQHPTLAFQLLISIGSTMAKRFREVSSYYSQET